MNLVIIILVAAIIIAMVIISNSSKNKADEVPEPLVNPNFRLDIEDPVSPVQAPEEMVETKSEILNEGLEKLEEPVVSLRKAVKAPAVKKASKPASKPAAKTSAKPAPKKTVVKKTK